jgi:hypothetical protein
MHDGVGNVWMCIHCEIEKFTHYLLVLSCQIVDVRMYVSQAVEQEVWIHWQCDGIAGCHSMFLEQEDDIVLLVYP